MKTAPNKLPKSKAKTAYGLLSDVRRVILAEPKRYNQTFWIARLNGKNNAFGLDPQIEPVPACGTVGCIAGWVATLKRGQRFGWIDAPKIARKTLGISDDQADQLFSGHAVVGVCGTPAYAKAGANLIARFQQKHAAQLRATKV